jgi:hypothetical protein
MCVPPWAEKRSREESQHTYAKKILRNDSRDSEGSGSTVGESFSGGNLGGPQSVWCLLVLDDRLANEIAVLALSSFKRINFDTNKIATCIELKFRPHELS